MESFPVPPRGNTEQRLRVTSRHIGVDCPTRRSFSLDGEVRAGDRRYVDPSLGKAESCSENDDERCPSPLPCQQGCRNLNAALLSPMINSVAIDKSVVLTQEGDTGTNPETPDGRHAETDQLNASECKSDRECPLDSKQANFAARKSIRELYGQPSWWGDGEGIDVVEKKVDEDASLQPRQKMSSYGDRENPILEAEFCRPSEAFTVYFDELPQPAIPRRQAEAFTITLEHFSEKSNPGESLSNLVPSRLRRAIQEREQLTKQQSTTPNRPLTAPAPKKLLMVSHTQKALPTRPMTTQPRNEKVTSAREGTSIRGVRLKPTTTRPLVKQLQRTGNSTTTPKPSATAVRKTFSQSPKPTVAARPPVQQHSQHPLTQRNRIPLRQTPAVCSTNRAAPSSRDQAASPELQPAAARRSAIKTSRAFQGSPTVLSETNQAPNLTAKLPSRGSFQTPSKGRDPTSRVSSREAKVNSTESGNHPTSPLQRKLCSGASNPGQQSMSPRSPVGEERRVSVPKQDSSLMAKAPAAASSNLRSTQTDRPFKGMKKVSTPIQRTTSLTRKETPAPTPTFTEPVAQAVWSYEDPKDYIMAKMFQGIVTSRNAISIAKSTTQSVFEEFTVVASAVDTKESVTCTPEEREELELFEKVEAEVNRCSAHSKLESDHAGAEVLIPSVEDLARTWIRKKDVSSSLEIPQQSADSDTLLKQSSASNENLANQLMSNAASTVNLEHPMTHPGDHRNDPSLPIRPAESFPSIAETYVLDANDTLAAEGVPPVVIYDSVEQLLIGVQGVLCRETNVMETSNTCTIPYQPTVTSRSVTPNEVDEQEELHVDADSLAEDYDSEMKAACNSGGARKHYAQDESVLIPEYFRRIPHRVEGPESTGYVPPHAPDKEGETPNRSSSAHNSNNDAREISKSANSDLFSSDCLHSSPNKFFHQSKDFCLVNSDTNSPELVDIAIPLSCPVPSNITPLLCTQGRIFPVKTSRSFQGISPSSCSSSSSSSSSSPPSAPTSSSSSSPIVGHFTHKFLQPEAKLTSTVPVNLPSKSGLQPTFSEMRKMQDAVTKQTHMASIRRSWNPESYEKEIHLYLRREASRSSVQSEYTACSQSVELGIQQHPRYKFRKNNSVRALETIYPFPAQLPMSINSTSSLDTALRFRNSQKSLNDVNSRIIKPLSRGSTSPFPTKKFSKGPDAHPHQQHRQTEVTHQTAFDHFPYKNAYQPISAPPTQILSGDHFTNFFDSHYTFVKPVAVTAPSNETDQQVLNLQTPLFNAANQSQPFAEFRRANQTLGSDPFYQSDSASTLSPRSIASACEPGYQNRTARRPTNSGRNLFRRFSLRNPSHLRADSPTPHDLFPSDIVTTQSVKTVGVVPPIRPVGIGISSIVPPSLSLQKRLETDGKYSAPSVQSAILHPTAANMDNVVPVNQETKSVDDTSISLPSIAKPIPQRLDPDGFRTSAFSAVGRAPVVLVDPRGGVTTERNRRSLSLSQEVGASDMNDDREHLDDTADDESYETRLASSILRLSNRLRRCSDHLAQRIGAPRSDISSPAVSKNWKNNIKTSTSLHQELNDSLTNMRTVEQQLQYMENVLFSGERIKHTETGYLHELERINNELRGFVPIGGDKDTCGAHTSISQVSTDATDSGVEISVTKKGAARTSNNGSTPIEDAFPNGEFY